MSNELALPESGSLNFDAFGGAVNDKASLISCAMFIAKRKKLTLVKGQRSMKHVKTLVSAEEVKTLSKEYDGHRRNHYRQFNALNALFAADETYRKSGKLWRNKKGDWCMNTMYRKDTTSIALAAEILSKENAALKAQIAKLQAPVA